MRSRFSTRRRRGRPGGPHDGALLRRPEGGGPARGVLRRGARRERAGRAGRDAVRAAPPLDLPVAFSPTGQAPLADLRTAADPGGAAAAPDEAVHHLLLCRVRVGRCAAVDCARDPPRHPPEGCDAVRDPKLPDLTFVYRAEHVYPEFLVQVVLEGGGRGETEGV